MKYVTLVMLLLVIIFCPMVAAADAGSVDGPWTVPILEIRYFPTAADGQRIDINITSNVSAKLDDIRKKCDRMTRQAIESLQEGSRFRAYNNPAPRPNLPFQVLGTKEYLEPPPRNEKKPKFPDYAKILQREDIKQWIEEKGVK